MKRKKKNLKKKLLIAIILLLACALAFLFYKVQLESKNEVIPEAGSSQNAVKPLTALEHNGEKATLKRHTDTVLLIGTDNFSENSEKSEVELFYNYQQSDLLVVLAFDNDNKTVTPFQVNRDTMASVPWLSVNGLVGGHVTEQIALSHTYGSGGNDSCENTRNAVSELLYNLPIDNYLGFTMDAVPIMNDLVGGVTVILNEDIPALGDNFVQGAEITLHGQTALKFVRTRELEGVHGNVERMSRQRQYVAGFTESARETAEKNPDLAVDAFKAIDKYLTTDLTVNDISEIVERLCNYEILPVVSPDGELKLGEEFVEFYVDDDSLWQNVKTVFCK